MPVAEIVTNIDQECKAIDDNKDSFQIRSLEHINEDTESGMPIGEYLQVYSRDKKTVYISVDIVGDLSGEVTEYYYGQSGLMYARTYSWHGAERQHVYGESTYYYHKGKLVKWTKSGTDIPVNSDEFSAEEKNMLERESTYQKIISE